jgi:hypothetical protein
MRLISGIASAFFCCLFLYVYATFWAVTAVISPSPPKPRPKPVPLEKAAPEVVALRGGFRRLAIQASAQVPLCPNRDPESEPPRPRGRVLIWDLDKDDVSEAHGRLAAELRLASLQENCTVYLITERHRRAVLNYNYDPFHGGGRSGVQGFRTDLAVCAIDMPSGQPRGRYRINGNGPPQIVTLEPADKEIDEDWAGNVQRWIDTCVAGPPARYYLPIQQRNCRYADEARSVIDQCEMLGSLPMLANMPREAIIWNPQTDRWHPAQTYIRCKADDNAEKLLMVLVLDSQLVQEGRGTGRFDYRVALVTFPGAQPLGVYQVRGEDWALPKPGDTWGPANSHGRNVHSALARWVERVCEGRRGLPAGTLPVAADATQLAGTTWLKGPGWLKRLARDPLPPEQQGWERMAEECSDAVAACRKKGSTADIGKLPKKIVVWMDHSEAFFPHPAQNSLPKDLRAGTRDTEVLMVLLVDSHYVQQPKGAPKTERFDYDLALFTMPGARPVGIYRVRGETLLIDRPRHGPEAKSVDTNKEIATWLTRFVASPQTVARQSAVR